MIHTVTRQMGISRQDLVVAGIVRAAKANHNITAAGLQDELERGDIDGWVDVVQRHAVTFGEWSGAMERAIPLVAALRA